MYRAWAKINNAFYQRQNSQGQYDSRLGAGGSQERRGIARVLVTDVVRLTAILRSR